MATAPNQAAQDKWIADNKFILANANVNGSTDGRIDGADVTLLRRWIAAYDKDEVKLGQGIQQVLVN
jgi:hypothetical protein